MTADATGRLRLASQGIARPVGGSPQQIVAWHGAMQGQDYAGAKWSVGLRLPGCPDAEVERAIGEHAVVRTWLLRGTLHLVAAPDVRWMLALVGPRQLAAGARRRRELELDAETLARSSTMLVEALRDGRERDRAELFALLERHGIATSGQRGYHILAHASLEGLICQGVSRRNVPSFIALDERVPAGPALAREEALAELARRYFTSHGPATLKDFAWWCGLAAADVRAGLEGAAPDLLRETVGETISWRGAGAHEPVDAAHGVFALPGFDEYLLGYADRGDVLDPQHAARISPGGNGVFNPTIVSDGRVVGTWKRAVTKGVVVVTPDLFRPLGAAEREGLAAAVAQYGRFLQMPAALAGER